MPNETEAPAEPPLLFYPNRKSAIATVLIAPFLLLVSFFALRAPFSPEAGITDTVAHALTAYLCPPMVTAFLIWAVLSLVRPRPLLTADPHGLTVPYVGLIPWRHIKTLRQQTLMNQPAIGIVLHDLDAFSEAVSPAQAKRARFNARQFNGTVALVAGRILPLPVSTVLSQLNAYGARHGLTDAPKST